MFAAEGCVQVHDVLAGQHRPPQLLLAHSAGDAQTCPSGHAHCVPPQVLPPVHALPQAPQLSLLFSMTHLLAQHVVFDAQQAPLHANCPPQSIQAVPAELHAPLEQGVVVDAAQVPLPLQFAALLAVVPVQLAVRQTVLDAAYRHPAPLPSHPPGAHVALTPVPAAQT